MSISYDEAVSIVRTVAQAKKIETKGEECVQLADALDRRASQDVRSPLNTPMFDSSAMDGYAVSSALTSSASPAKPVHLRIEGTIAAGDTPLHLPCDIDEQGRTACVEIMTGAPFPRSTLGPEFDACVPWEHTSTLVSAGNQPKTIRLTKPPKPNQNRRFAGHDFRRDDVIVAKGSELGPHHVMAMASVGIATVPVERSIHATVITTGSELQEHSSLISNDASPKLPDCNGPFLLSSLRTFGIQVSSFTGVSDDLNQLQHRIAKAVSSRHCDILITTGGVSAGKFDFVPEAIVQLGGSVHFHHVAMRPGHPVLFASLPASVGNESNRDVALFGLPGNPIAAAACYRFLVVPYLRVLLGQSRELPMCDMKISTNVHDMRDDETGFRKDRKLDCFRHAQMRGGSVVMSSEQSPGKVRPFAHANCWVHLGTGISEVKVGDQVDCYPLNSKPVSTLGGDS